MVSLPFGAVRLTEQYLGPGVNAEAGVRRLRAAVRRRLKSAVPAKDWAGAQKLLDGYLEGKATVGAHAAFRDARKELPAEATFLSLIDGRVVAVADELGLEHRNLRPLLNEGLRHYYDHDHFTPGGAAVVARAVASALTGQDQSQRPGSSVETPVRRLTQPRVPLAAR